jgi:hypothetical protein
MVITQFAPATTLSDADTRRRGSVDLTNAVWSALFAGTGLGEEDSDEVDNMADDEANTRPTRKLSVYQRKARRNSGNRSSKQHQEVGQRGQLIWDRAKASHVAI